MGPEQQAAAERAFKALLAAADAEREVRQLTLTIQMRVGNYPPFSLAESLLETAASEDAWWDDMESKVVSAEWSEPQF
mgnify:CR=1 FL=1